MKSLYELCTPRDSVFQPSLSEDALDLANLIDNNIDANRFFEETYMTTGLTQVLDAAFKRFQGKNDIGIIRLRQAMGGGKSHCLISLGLLAQKALLRHKVLNGKYDDIPDYIQVVAFTGRETDTDFGIWGEIASQLGKRNMFSKYYTPLEAPGQRAWVELLKSDKPTLILLDELPPYLENAKSKQVGTGNLAEITVTALANLFNAVNKKELSNVLIVISDLRSTYEVGSELIEKSFKNLEGEVNRLAMDIEPVRANSDDLYSILQKKCFKNVPSKNEIEEIAKAYQTEISRVKQMGATSLTPDTIYRGILETYPFHPCIRDLFARFKENTNFQQTRGFIRLVRHMVRCLWTGEIQAQNKFLINACDIDLKDPDTFSFVKNIKPKLDKAIAHDISSDNAVSMAEECDYATGKTDTQDLCKMILVSSLGDVSGILLGLSESEILGNMASPNVDVASYGKLINEYKSKAWYLYSDKEGRLFYKDLKNVNADMIDRASSYSGENAKQEIRKLLSDQFNPTVKDVYQIVKVFPAIDEISLLQDKVTLILFEPNIQGGGLQPNLLQWYEDQTFKNRVCFLTGQRANMNQLYEAAKRHKAIMSIINELKDEKQDSQSNTQYKQATDILDRIRLDLASALKEIFVTLYYPTKNGLKSHEIIMTFGENNFNPEEQIRKLLSETVQKFSLEMKLESFRMRIERDLFTAEKMGWPDVTYRAATNTGWIWHLPNTLNDAKKSYLQNGIWIEEGSLINKNPPKPKTSIQIKEIDNDFDSRTVTLKITPRNGDKVYYEIGQPATEASTIISINELEKFKTTELKLFFLCVDTTGKHPTGDCIEWKKTIHVKYNLFDSCGDYMCELKADAENVDILYSTNGMDPILNGALYQTPFAIPKNSRMIQAVAQNSKYSVTGEKLSKEITNNTTSGINIDKNKPLILCKNRIIKADNTYDVIKLLDELDKFNILISQYSVNICPINEEKQWLEMSSGNLYMDAKSIQTYFDNMIQFFGNSQILATFEAREIKFSSGAQFESWIRAKHAKISDYIEVIVQ